MRRIRFVFFVAALLAGSGTGHADLVCADSSYAVASFACIFTGDYRPGEPKNIVTVAPNSKSETLASAGITIGVYLRNCAGLPLAGVPAAVILLVGNSTGMCTCIGGNRADAATDTNGYTTFTGQIRAGGCAPSVSVVADGVTIGTVPVQFNSPDRGKPTCGMDTHDVNPYFITRNGYGSRVGDPDYSICIDLNEDGVVDVTDFAMFGAFLHVDQLLVSGDAMKNPRSAIVLGLAAVLATTPAQAIRLGVFADPAGTSCNLMLPLNQPTTAYLLAILDAPEDQGVTGMEFRITGMPPSSAGIFSSPGSDAAWLIGSPLFEGAYVAFGSCRSGNGRVVQLGTVSMFATMAQAPFTLRVEAHAVPGNTDYACLVVTLCDSTATCNPAASASAFSKVCVEETLDLHVNGDPCTTGFEGAFLRFHGAWPNPAREGTTLRFAIPQRSRVRIEVFDVAGRSVRQLLDTTFEAGDVEARWDGRNGAGEKLPSGVYLVRIVTPTGTAHERITLVR